MELGEQIATLREERALTQAKLAKKARISPSTLSLIESGKVPRPHVGTVRKIARALDIEPLELRSVKESTSPKVEAPPSLAEFLEERCGHAYLARPKGEFEEMFDRLEEDELAREELALAVNEEYNAFCNFPKNVTPTERIAMRKIIRNAIREVAVKHSIALVEGGLDREYQEEAERIFEVEHAILSDEDIA